MKGSKYLIVVGGPTASGKTGVAVELAKHYDTEVLSADSRQFYQEMSIGTAKPSKEEMENVVHHFVDHISVQKHFSVGDFEREGLDVLEDIFKKRAVAILAGGSGLYIRALCEGLDVFPDVPVEVRAQLNLDFEKKGLAFLQEELAQRDPAYFEIVDQNNPQRLIRALEICRSSGATYSSFRKGTKAQRPFQPIYIQLEWDRAVLYERINRRVDLMMANGLLDEARALAPFQHLNALQSVGYQELFDYFDQKISLDEAVELIKRNSRRYAKRQLTWLRKNDFWKGFAPQALEAMKTYINARMETSTTDH